MSENPAMCPQHGKPRVCEIFEHDPVEGNHTVLICEDCQRERGKVRSRQETATRSMWTPRRSSP